MNNDDFAVGGLSGQTGGASLSFDGDTPKTTGDVDLRTMNSAFSLTDTPNLDGHIMETSHNGTRKNQSRYAGTQHRWVNRHEVCCEW
jgi:hypothetical protein